MLVWPLDHLHIHYPPCLNSSVAEVEISVPFQFLQDILLQYVCSKTVPTENRIEMKTKIHLSLFYFHFNYVVNRPDTTALGRDKQYGGNGEFF